MKRILLILFTVAISLVSVAQHTSSTVLNTKQTEDKWLQESYGFCKELIEKCDTIQNPSKDSWQEKLKGRSDELNEIIKKHDKGASPEDLRADYFKKFISLVNDFFKSQYTEADKDMAQAILSKAQILVDENIINSYEVYKCVDNRLFYYRDWLSEIADVCWRAESDYASVDTRAAWQNRQDDRAGVFVDKLDSCRYNSREEINGIDFPIPYFDSIIDKAKARVLLYREKQKELLTFDDILPAELIKNHKPAPNKRVLLFVVTPKNIHAVVKVKAAGAADYESWGQVERDGTTSRSLEFGTYTYMVTAEGYKDVSGSVILTDTTTIKGVHVSLKKPLIPRKTRDRFNRVAGVLHDYSLYFQPTFQVGRTVAAGFAMGGYINKINVEVGGLFGLKSQEVHWKSSMGDVPRSENLHTSAFTLRAGYGITLVDRLRLTPQLGVNVVGLKGDISQSNASAFTLGARFEYDFCRHCGINIVPEYGVTMRKSDTYGRLKDAGVKDTAGGFNLKVGFNIFF